jgi:ATP-dependent Lon protease
MYYTPMGGDIMFVEASASHGKDKLILTGQLGDVMKESARAALTYAKTHHDRLGIPEEAFRDVEIHIHVPAGAIPKDGPSAGITMATALVSALSARPVRSDVAMTGEITLNGLSRPAHRRRVKEKVLGASYRAGIREVIRMFPEANEPHLDDLPEDSARPDDSEFHAVGDLGHVPGRPSRWRGAFAARGPHPTLTDGNHIVVYHEANGTPGSPIVCGAIPAEGG